MAGKTIAVVITCDGAEVLNGPIEEWFQANEDEREYLADICESILNGTGSEVSFSEISGEWLVKVK